MRIDNQQQQNKGVMDLMPQTGAVEEKNGIQMFADAVKTESPAAVACTVQRSRSTAITEPVFSWISQRYLQSVRSILIRFTPKQASRELQQLMYLSARRAGKNLQALWRDCGRSRVSLI